MPADPASDDTDRSRAPGHRPGTRATQLTGRLLCWSLATAMTLTALDAATSTPSWWPLLRTALWLFVPAAGIGWALARRHEKQQQRAGRHPVHTACRAAPEPDAPNTAASTSAAPITKAAPATSEPLTTMTSPPPTATTSS
ncbi:hypothetical protein ABZ916_23490 [Streptomyces sp. NPDC046853]|uniref:hypothetical protein n=1 Tax=Streptomyces sp. NPDC046853 TaxID=3154920 RepID=UPI00340232CD